MSCHVITCVAENMDFALSDDFCRKHFLIGILLREVSDSLYIFMIIMFICVAIAESSCMHLAIHAIIIFAF